MNDAFEIANDDIRTDDWSSVLSLSTITPCRDVLLTSKIYATLALATLIHLLAKFSTSVLSKLINDRGTWTSVEAITVNVNAKKMRSVLSLRAVKFVTKVGRCKQGIKG